MAKRKGEGVLGPMRIIGGKLRGSKLKYHGDPGTRPMKERVREAVFNLVGPSIKGKLTIDLFGGTGAIGLESLSRGAEKALFIERNFPTARVIKDNIASLQLDERCIVETSDTFFYFRPHGDWITQVQTILPHAPWAMFCCPPYALYQTRRQDLIDLITRLMDAAPDDSVFVVECDENFDHLQLPSTLDWDVRTYRPAVIAMSRK